MTWKCFFLGCRWNQGMQIKVSGELLRMQQCKRCASCRIQIA